MARKKGELARGQTAVVSTVSIPKKPFLQRVKTNWKRNKWKYILLLPVVLYFLIFAYKPMYGIIIAFQNYKPTKGFSGSEWVGLTHFINFFSSRECWRVVRNTFSISLLSIIFGFPAPILLALLLNEIRHNKFKRVIQTISYLPHFVSIVIICGLIKNFCLTDGAINSIIGFFGGQQHDLLQDKSLFYPIYVATDIWQEIGWGSIIYLAAIAGIDQEQYEAAIIDGAGKLAQILHITLPGIMPTITVLFILRMGAVLNVGFEKVLLLYNPVTYEVADVISTYVYRVGLMGAQYSFSTAVSLVNSLVNIIFLVVANAICNKVNGSGLF